MKTRIELLEAVAEAARALLDQNLGRTVIGWRKLDQALAALDARTAVQEVTTLAAVKEAFEGAKAQNETSRSVLSSQTPATVTLAMWRSVNGEVMLDIAGSNGDVSYNETWRRIGTVTLPLDQEAGR